MRLVDHEQPAPRSDVGQHRLAKARAVEPLRADQQHIHLSGLDRLLDPGPLIEIGGVDGFGANTRPGGRLQLVAHQREQRTDDEGDAGPPLAQERGSREIDGALTPAGALHDEHPGARKQRLDGPPLIFAQKRIRPGKLGEHGLSCITVSFLSSGRVHDAILTGTSDRNALPRAAVLPVGCGQCWNHRIRG